MLKVTAEQEWAWPRAHSWEHRPPGSEGWRYAAAEKVTAAFCVTAPDTQRFLKMGNLILNDLSLYLMTHIKA